MAEAVPGLNLPGRNERSTRVVRAVTLLIALAATFLLFWPARIASPIEGDDVGIAIGVFERVADFDQIPRFGYNYHFQPGAVNISALVARATGWDAFESFYLFSLISAVLAVALAGHYAARVGHVSFGIGILSVLAYPESFMIAHYANANTAAAVFGTVALILALRATGWGGAASSGIALGVAAWMRCDVLIIAPAVALHSLFADQPSSMRQVLLGVLRAGVCGVMSVATLAPLLYLTDSDLIQVYVQISDHQSNYAFWDSLVRQAYFFPVITWILMPLGVWHLARERRWGLLIPILVGGVTVYATFSRLLVTPKYLYYALPFYAALAAAGVRAILNARPVGLRVAAGALVALASLQFLIGYMPPENEQPGRLVLDAGVWVDTHDGHRFLTGIWWTPAWYEEQHTRTNRELARQSEFLNRITADPKPATIYRASDSWIGFNGTLYQLMAHGFTIKPGEVEYNADGLPVEVTYQRGGQLVTIIPVHRVPAAEIKASRWIKDQGRWQILVGGWELDIAGLEILEKISGAENVEHQVYLLAPDGQTAE